VFAVSYNLPPPLCMKYGFMFLCLIIPSPNHREPKLNVMLKPLIDDLIKLLKGVESNDPHKKKKFTLQAAYLSSFHNFMAYDIFVGWSIHGRLTCRICGSDTDCFHLTYGQKICYFNCHRCWLPHEHPLEHGNIALGKTLSPKRDH
jgi:hypothetical protein